MHDEAIPVLFVSRHDGLRSVLASACMQHVARGRFHVHCCGMPGEIAAGAHRAALDALAQARIEAQPHQPRSWESYRRLGAPRMRFLIVLDALAAARLPTWPHQPDIAVWAYPDLLAAGSPPADKVWSILLSLRRRLEIFANLPMRGVSREALRQDVQDLGQL